MISQYIKYIDLDLFYFISLINKHFILFFTLTNEGKDYVGIVSSIRIKTPFSRSILKSS